MRFIYLFIGLLIIASCKSPSSTYHITGNAPDVYNGIRVYLQELDASNQARYVDTAIVMDQKFFFDNPVRNKFPELRILTMDGAESNLIFLLDKEKLSIILNKDSLWSSTLIGSKQNTALLDFKKTQMALTKKAKNYSQQRVALSQQGNIEAANAITTQWIADEDVLRNKGIQIITSNPDNIVSTILLGELFSSKIIEPAQAQNYYEQLSNRLKEEPLSKQLIAVLNQYTVTEIGRKAPEFEALTPQGAPLKLSQTLGKYTLIDFWASWCGPCRQENPNVVNAYQKYHDKGFNIISVSLDRPGADAAWKAAIEKDNMTWFHVSNLQHWNDPIAKSYNVKGIPATFLVDKNGVIIARNLRGQELHRKLAELLD